MNPTSQQNANINTNKELPSKDSNTYTSTTYEYVTKGRKTLYDSSSLHLQSPKKQNPSRSKRIELLKLSRTKDSKNETNLEQKDYNINLINNDKNMTYKPLVKKIAIKLRRRVNFPTAKIIKIYQPYRTLILRIATGIKNTAKTFNFWNKYEQNITRAKFGIKIMRKESNSGSKNRFSAKNSKQKKKEMNDNINILLSIDDSNKNIDFINEFEKFLGKNGVEILSDTKLPSFKNKDNEYLLGNIHFWTRYINFVCWKYKTELTFFNFINFIEQFFIWINGQYDADIFKRLIIEKIELIFDRNKISDFLLMHKLNEIDDLFARYKIMNTPEKKEFKIDEDCECPTCQEMKKKSLSVKKFPLSKTLLDNESKDFSINTNLDRDKKITDYYRCSIKLRPSKIKTQSKIVQYNEDKKIVDYFNFKKIDKVEEKKKSRSKSKSKSKSKNKKKSKNNSKSKKNKNKNNGKKPSINNKVQEIKDLLNL